jgi:hypothetical protein
MTRHSPEGSSYREAAFTRHSPLATPAERALHYFAENL